MKLAFPESEITGIDINDDHKYPYDFIQSDVFDLDYKFFEKFDLIHASPPCQHYSWSTRKDRIDKFPDLVERTRLLLNRINKPFTMENVVGAPLRKDIILCGEMFGLRVIRHRIFEIEGFSVMQPPHIKHRQPISKNKSYYACVAGHGGDGYSFKLEDWKNAIGIDWVNDKTHLSQMIPPKYFEYILKYFR